jgi:hypothetical protein
MTSPDPEYSPVCVPLRGETQRIVIVMRAFFSFLPTLLAANHPLSYPRRRALSLGFVVMGQRSLTGSLGLPACTCRRRKREDRRGGSEHRDRRPYRHYQCPRAWRPARTPSGLGRRAGWTKVLHQHMQISKVPHFKTGDLDGLCRVAELFRGRY